MAGFLQLNNGLNKINEWDERSAAHLLSRTLYGYTKEELDFALSLSIDDYVDNYLLADNAAPQSPGFWVTDTSNSNSNVRSYELTFWWFNLMLTQGHSFREKMVLFLHNHFVSEISVVKLPQRMYWQNKLFRDHVFGNFKELTKAVTIDPAMLIYLDGTKNRASDPNENYARELLELFTIGIGNYNETDIAEAARALTGWQVEGLGSYFDPERFDDTPKTFMEETGNFNHNDIVDIIFTREETASFICSKLFKEFVHYEPNETYIAQLAQILRENNYELKPVLSTLLKATMFYSDEIIGAKIKSPVELIIGLHKQFKIQNPDYEYMRVRANQLNQTLFSPPNVAGWPGDKLWISTNTLPARNTFTDRIVDGKESDFNIIEYARSYSSAENAVQFVEDITKIFLQYAATDNRKNYLLEILLDGAAVYDWSTYNENAEARLHEFFKALLRLSEYQLS
jgi:uncharacterized protein (DUF1800 family)